MSGYVSGSPQGGRCQTMTNKTPVQSLSVLHRGSFTWIYQTVILASSSMAKMALTVSSETRLLPPRT